MRLLLYILWLGFVPFGVVVSILQPPIWLIAPVAITWMVLSVVLGFANAIILCPVCHERFCIGYYVNHFTSKCMHCGLPLKSKKLDSGT
jgi:hypothetical protein